MRAIAVAVDYAGEARLTIPYNLRHFTDMMVVTAPGDECGRIARDYGCQVYETTAFWEDGGRFRKYLALERALDAFGRHGWLALIDVDIFWPKTVRVTESADGNTLTFENPPSLGRIRKGQICTPHRRMFPTVPEDVPVEAIWNSYPPHRNYEHAGWTQIFHCDDPVLGKPPWHDVQITHAGLGDSLFHMKWKPVDKVRPPFDVLHIGEPSANWMGRTSKRADGTIPANADLRRAALRDMIRRRKQGPDRFAHERLP